MKNSTIKLLHAKVVFYHIESFSANKILNNVKKNELYLIQYFKKLKWRDMSLSHIFI